MIVIKTFITLGSDSAFREVQIDYFPGTKRNPGRFMLRIEGIDRTIFISEDTVKEMVQLSRQNQLTQRLNVDKATIDKSEL